MNFKEIAIEQRRRGFEICVVHPDEKRGVRTDQYEHESTLARINWLAETYPTANVGVWSRRGKEFCFLDIDSDGVIERIERDTNHVIPATYTVQSSPRSAPFKRHLYFRQTELARKSFPKNMSRQDWTRTVNKNGNQIHPEVYAFKGIGGGSFVVAAGCQKRSGEIYTVTLDEAIPEIPEWLVNWLVADRAKMNAEKGRWLYEIKEAKKNKSTAELNRLKATEPYAFAISEGEIDSFVGWRVFTLGQHCVPQARVIEITTADVARECAGGVKWLAAHPTRVSERAEATAGLRFRDIGFFKLKPKSKTDYEERPFVHNPSRHQIVARFLAAVEDPLTTLQLYRRVRRLLNEKGFKTDGLKFVVSRQCRAASMVYDRRSKTWSKKAVEA